MAELYFFGASDVLLGEIHGCNFYMVRSTTKSRLFTEEEEQDLVPAQPADIKSPEGVKAILPGLAQLGISQN